MFLGWRSPLRQFGVSGAPSLPPAIPCTGLLLPRGIWGELPCSLLPPFLLPEARACAKWQLYLHHLACLVFMVKHVPHLSAALEWKCYKAKGQFSAASLRSRKHNTHFWAVYTAWSVIAPSAHPHVHCFYSRCINLCPLRCSSRRMLVWLKCWWGVLLMGAEW